MNSRGGDVKILATTERGDYEHHDNKRAGLPLSDGEGGAYDENSSLKRRDAANMKRQRESI